MSRITAISVCNLWQLLESLWFDSQLSNTIWGLIIELMCQQFFSWIIPAAVHEGRQCAVLMLGAERDKVCKTRVLPPPAPTSREDREDSERVRGPNKAGLINPPRLQQTHCSACLPAWQCHRNTNTAWHTCDIVGLSIKLSNITTFRHWNCIIKQWYAF